MGFPGVVKTIKESINRDLSSGHFGLGMLMTSKALSARQIVMTRNAAYWELRRQKLLS